MVGVAWLGGGFCFVFRCSDYIRRLFLVIVLGGDVFYRCRVVVTVVRWFIFLAHLVRAEYW